MAEPMATKKELAELRKRGMKATPANVRKVRAIMKQNEKNAKTAPRNPVGGMSKKNISAPSEPTGMKKGGMVSKKKYANCGASVKASGGKRK